MPYPWTLQRYIFREMGKTFLLTAVALTGVLGLGGGVLQMIKLGEVTPAQLARLMLLVLPLAAALTLPIAALFSAAATYGRIAGDNEFVACRSSGINLHVLFLPAVVLSLVSALVTFALSNFVIPGMVRNLHEFVGADFGAIIQQKLNRPRGITLGGRFRICADESTIDVSDPDRIALHNVAFIEVDGEQWIRFGTAREVQLNLDRTGTRWKVAGMLYDLSYYNRQDRGFFENAEQTIEEAELPPLVPPQIKFLSLGELFYYWSRPGRWREALEEMNRLRQGLAQWRVYEAVWDDWLADRQFTIEDDRVHYVVTARNGGRVPGEGDLELLDVTIEEQRTDRRRRITGDRAFIRVVRGDTLAESGLRIDVHNARARDGADWIQRTKETLGPVMLDPELVAELEQMSDADLLAASRMPEEGDPLARRREKAENTRAEALRRIVGTIHERTAFSISVVVLVTLGAALGIILRGSHVMTAFGISFVPSLFVIVTIVMGKQMSHNAPTHVLGLLVIWGGIGLVAALDAWTLTRVLRR
jgi:lipopolysaccharide export LptBFGC system permease protein LptF